MERIIDRMRYDTEKSETVASDYYWDGSNYERGGRNTYLMKTSNGRFFLYRTTLWQGETDTIEPLDADKAKDAYESLPEQTMDFKEAFGEEPPEA